MSLAYIRDYYQVPAHRYRHIVFTGERGRGPRLGTIVAAKGARLRVRFTDTGRIETLHPTWEVTYPDDTDLVIDGMRVQHPVRFAKALAGHEPADNLSSRDRRLLVAHLHGSGLGDLEVAELTRMSLYTCARIREELGLTPLPDREKGEELCA